MYVLISVIKAALSIIPDMLSIDTPDLYPFLHCTIEQLLLSLSSCIISIPISL